MTASHELVNPDGLAEPAGYTHVVVAAPGRLVFVAGQIASDADGVCRGETIAERRARAAESRRRAGSGGRRAGARRLDPDLHDRHGGLPYGGREIGERYRTVFGRHCPAISLFEVTRLYDPAALVEIVCTAVIP